MFSRIQDNQSDGNLFDQRNNSVSLCAENTENLLDLLAWQRYYELDKNSTQAIIEANFDPETIVFTYRYDGEKPKHYSKFSFPHLLQLGIERIILNRCG
jgi:hypothetical protein